jgi:environmental stress-induced protein Ves
MPFVVRFAERPAEPWANGLGSTVEIARDPATGAFDWRLSVARLEDDSAFSLLPGVDRVLMALGDDPVGLNIGDGLRVLKRHDTVVFTGDEAVRPEGLEHPTHALNLMTRRGRVDGWLDTLDVTGELAVSTPGRVIVMVLEGALRLADADGEPPLTKLDAAVGETGEGLHLSGTGLLAVARLASTPDGL